VVALGAAVQANEVADQGGAALLIDVASHSLGVEVLGGRVRKLIEKNTAIPVSAREIFLPGRHGQKEARISIFQGESDDSRENRKLGEIVLRDLHARDRAENPLEVTFELSAEGTLAVKATDLSSGVAEAIRIEARTEMSQSEVERLRNEQGAYTQEQGVEDAAAAADRFKKLLEKGEKLAIMLEKTAAETPSEEANTAVASVRVLIDRGRAALQTNNPEVIADIARQLTKLGVVPR
jgi:molecular chaperone DnaK